MTVQDILAKVATGELSADQAGALMAGAQQSQDVAKTSSGGKWVEVEIKSLAAQEADYRKKNAVASEAREVLEKAIRAKLEAHHKADLADGSNVVVLSFRFGKISYALLPKDETRKKGGSKKAALVL